MLHLRVRIPRSWPRRAPPVDKRDASDGSSGEKPSPGWSCAVRMASCSLYLGTGRTFPFPLTRLLTWLSPPTRCCWPHNPSSSWCGLCGIMQENLAISAEERKERSMIHILARLVSRHAYRPREGIHEAVDSLPPLCEPAGQTSFVSHVCSDLNVFSPDPPTLAADPSAQALVVLFTQLAQRRMQALRKPGGPP
jgi:hypothetical protein